MATLSIVLERKQMLLLGVISVAIILLFYPLAQTGMQLLTIRFLHGLAGGVLIPAAFAFIGDQTKKQTRGKTMAFTGASIGIAAILGPALGGAMAAQSKVEHVFIFVSILFVVTSVLIIKYVKDTYTTTDRGKASLKQFIPLLKNPFIMQASLAAFALMVSNGTLAFALPLKVEDISLSSAVTGMLLSTFGITALIVFLMPINRIYDRFSPVVLVLTGIGLISASLVVVNYMSNFWVGFIAMIVYGFGFALIFPSMNRMVADATTESNRGKAYGVFYAFFSLGVVAGSTCSGIVSQYLGMPFIFSALVMFMCGVLLFVMTKVTQKDTSCLD